MNDYEHALKGDSLGYTGFLAIADEYSSTKAGNLAELYAGMSYAQMGNYEEAVKYLQNYDNCDDAYDDFFEDYYDYFNGGDSYPGYSYPDGDYFPEYQEPDSGTGDNYI